MADPVSLGIMMAATAAGGIISAYGQEKSAAATKSMYSYQAGVDRALSGAADASARLARQSGEVDAQKAGQIARATLGRERAQAGASNIAGASKEAVGKSIQALGYENQALARARAEQTAYGESVHGASLTAEAGAKEMAGRYALEAGDIGAAASIVGAAGQVSGEWLKYKTLVA